MYAVIETGGKQYRVEQGEILRVEKLPGKVGDEFQCERVLLLGDKENISIGTPTVPKASVIAKILAEEKEKKVIAFKYKRRKTYRRTKGHRQTVSVIKIEQIKMS